MQNITLITGATCSGKTQFAIDFAKKNNAIVINSDAFQVYKEIPILSATPTLEEMNNVQHLLFSVWDGSVNNNVAKMLNLIHKTVEDNRDRNVLIVGGTPMYQNAILNGISDMPEISEDVKNKVKDLNKEECFEMLTKLDPLSAKKLHHNDTQRVLRALHITLETGRSILEFQTNKKTPFQNINKIIIEEKKDVLLQKAYQRLLKMIDLGAVEEVENLKQKAYNPINTIFQAHGIREFLSYINGEISKQQAIEQILRRTKQYQKHQITWLLKLL